MRWVAASVLLLLLVPAGKAGIVTSLYASFDDGYDFRLSPEPPRNETASTGACLADGTGTNTTSDSTWTFFPTAGPVQYEYAQNGTPRFHPEFGLSRDIHVEAAQLVWALLWPGPLPSPPAHLAVELRDHRELDSGNLLAHGATDIGVLQPGVTEVLVPMTVEPGAVLPMRDGYHVTVTFHDGADCARPEQLRVASASLSQHRSRLQLTVTEGVYISYLHPQPASGILLIHAAFNSPWGTADLDIGKATLQIVGPSAPADVQKIIPENSHVHNLHDKSVEVTWLWNWRDASPGDYNLTLTVWDRAHASSATVHAQFHLDAKHPYGTDQAGNIVPDATTPTQNAPAPAALLLLALAVVAHIVSRKR